MKKIVVRFKESSEPQKSRLMSLLEEKSVQFKQLYSIEPEVKNLLSNRGIKESDKSSHFELFNKEILPHKTEEEKKLYRTYTAEFENEDEAAAAIEKLKADPSIEFVQESKLNKLYYIPNDPHIKDLWGIAKINCPKAWDNSFGENVVVGVLDTGVDYHHPDLSDNMWKDSEGNFGFDFSDNKQDPMDYHSHGTHVAGTIAAVGNNFMGVVGVAPKAKIMAIKIFPNATDDVCAAAIKFAVDNGAQILNNSWGPSERNPENKVLEDVVDYALSKGVVMIFAAGNENDDVRYYSPANHPGVISVAATDFKDNRWTASNFGSEVTVSAPGKDILSTQLKGGYISKNGTSMAAPHVSGLAALIKAKYPSYTGGNIKNVIQNNCDKIISDQPMGSGRINAANSL